MVEGDSKKRSSVVVMRLCRTWDVRVPPPKKVVIGGKLMPAARGAFGMIVKKRRRITIEIHGFEQSEEGERDSKSVKEGLSKALLDDDRVVVRILKPRKSWGFSSDPDDSSDDEDSDGSPDSQIDEGWVEYRKFGLDEIVEPEVKGPIFEATVGLGGKQERRQVKFENDDQSQDFWNELSELKSRVKERAQARLDKFRASQARARASIAEANSEIFKIKSLRSINTAENQTSNISASGSMEPTRDSYSGLTESSEIELLVEIVSATDLPIADRNSTDPILLVFMGKQEIHRTKVVSKSLNPIWTVSTGSLFLLSTSAQEFFESSTGLTFRIQDHDGLNRNDDLCQVHIDQTTLLSMDGDRHSFKFITLKNHKHSSEHFCPQLHLRARKATPEDREFLRQLPRVLKCRNPGIYADQTFVGPGKERVRPLKRESRMQDGVKHFRVKPFPDPTRPEQETKWLHQAALDEECSRPSKKWLEAGSGNLGKIYLEVLRCDGLPNMDIGIDGKTDAFCNIIYEDSIVSTDVINDTNKPRWVPWCQRAFVFRMSHPSSQLLLGVFDYDSLHGKINAHDPIGRISIDVTNFRRDTDYVLTYNLYRSVLDNERETFGTITVRLRMEYSSYRELIKGSLQLPPVNYINLPKKVDFKSSFFVIHGEENLARFDSAALTAYRTELESYLGVLPYIKDALTSLILWRGTVYFGKDFKLPVNSAVAFYMGIKLIDNFNLAPSYFLFAIAWLLITTNRFRLRNPSPWHGTLSYAQLWYAVLADEAPPVVVDPHENEAAIKAYNNEVKARTEAQIAKAQEAAANAERLNAFLSQESESAAEAFEQDISTKVGGAPSVNPLAKVLLPIQQILGSICIYLRIATSIVLWSESIYAFILVNACLVLGIAFLWVPWGFLLRWTVRILIWVLLGPWMKLVDVYYFQNLDDKDNTATKIFQELAEQKLETVRATRDALMQHKEEVTKMRDMRRILFGKFVTRVPQLKEYRYPDIPLAESSAKPVRSSRPVQATKRSHGQTLVGYMIPTWGDAVDAAKEKEADLQNETD